MHFKIMNNLASVTSIFDTLRGHIACDFAGNHSNAVSPEPYQLQYRLPAASASRTENADSETNPNHP